MYTFIYIVACENFVFFGAQDRSKIAKYTNGRGMAFLIYNMKSIYTSLRVVYVVNLIKNVTLMLITKILCHRNIHRK